MILHTDEEARKIIKKFCGQFFWLRNVRHIYKELFENDHMSVLMKRTATSFFNDLNTIIQHYLLLEFVKITDPAKNLKQENFTVENLIASIDWPDEIRQKLISLNHKTKCFRKHILAARHKLLAHMDKATILAERTLGGFPEGEDEKFLEALQEICDITHEACFGTIFGTPVLAMPGDVINLKRTLENAIAFVELLSESSKPEKTRLFSYLEKTRPGPISAQSELNEEKS